MTDQNNKKFLIFADIHEKTRYIEKIIKLESPDETIFLGDMFDSFVTTADTVKATCEWLIHSLNQPNRIHLMGNHEAWYRWPLIKEFICSGNTLDKREYINSVIKFEDWKKLKLFHFDGKYLYSHAGISKVLFSHPIHGITLSGIKEICDTATEYTMSGIAHPILRAGWSRGGNERHGGILWQDWSETKPIIGFHEIIGHTPFNSPNFINHVKYIPNKSNCLGSINCIDFNGKFYAIIKSGVISYKSTGCEGYNEKEHKLTGKSVVEHTTKIIDGKINYIP